MARTSAVPATPARKARAVMANATCAALIAAAVAVVASSPPGAGPSAGGGSNLGRFAALTFGGDRGGRAALVVASTDSCGRGAAGPSPGPSNVPPVAVTQYCTPNGWLLRPAGTQIDTPRAPTGVTVSPDHQTAYVVNSGIFDQQLVVIDAKTLTKTTALATDLYMGVAADRSGNVWASGGSRNRVFQFFDAGPVAVGTRHVGLVPGSPNNGIPVAGYPGNMALGHDASAGKLFVAGNLSVPQAVFGGTCPNGAPAADPTWLAGASSLSDAQSRCGGNGLTGGVDAEDAAHQRLHRCEE